MFQNRILEDLYSVADVTFKLKATLYEFINGILDFTLFETLVYLELDSGWDYYPNI